MWQTVQIPAARQLDLRASASGHEYRLFISVPSSPAPKNGFPVFYVLDGNAAFPGCRLLARSAVSRSEVSGHIPPIVVGIGYPGNKDFDVAARRRDYTLARTTPIDEPDAGGADRFLDFIENEVKPLIAENQSGRPQSAGNFRPLLRRLVRFACLTDPAGKFFKLHSLQPVDLVARQRYSTPCPPCCKAISGHGTNQRRFAGRRSPQRQVPTRNAGGDRQPQNASAGTRTGRQTRRRPRLGRQGRLSRTARRGPRPRSVAGHEPRHAVFPRATMKAPLS